LWPGARQILTDNRRSMKSAGLLQWLRVCLNLHLISDEEALQKLGVSLCKSEHAFDGVCDELMSMEDGDLGK
jgi:hypothetical protein